MTRHSGSLWNAGGLVDGSHTSIIVEEGKICMDPCNIMAVPQILANANDNMPPWPISPISKYNHSPVHVFSLDGHLCPAQLNQEVFGQGGGFSSGPKRWFLDDVLTRSKRLPLYW